MTTLTRTAIPAVLDRHESRRASRLPTVSVLAGPVGLGVREGRIWAESRKRPVVVPIDDRAESMARAWGDRASEWSGLTRAALARIARETGEDVNGLGPRVARMSPTERDMFLDATLPGSDGIDAVCRSILGRVAVGELSLGGLVDLVPAEAAPVLLVVPGPGAIETNGQSLACLVLAQPRLTAILAVDAGELDAYLRTANESRAKALIRSGVIPVAGLDRDEIARRLAGAIPAENPAIAGRLAADGASDELVGRFQEAALAAKGPEDRARSAAERFLFERLESLAATAGLFELNATLDIPFGPGRGMEVDLVSRALGLAIEVDGYYHFRDEDAYRRDRRKDVSLQSRGYLVIRVLAEDVVRRLEDVLDTILAAVACRRHPDREPRP